MSDSKKARSISLQSVFGTFSRADSSESPGHLGPDQAAVVRRHLAELESDLGINPDEREQWSAFSNSVLAQMERLALAREAADSVPWSDSASDDRKRALVKQVIATPVLLSLAATRLYSALTPEQRAAAGGKLLHFHRRLVG